jgi:hypothetical protein
MTTTKEESADTRVKVSLIKEAIAEIEAVVHKHLRPPNGDAATPSIASVCLSAADGCPSTGPINRWATAGSASRMRGPQPRRWREADTRLKPTRTGRCFFLETLTSLTAFGGRPRGTLCTSTMEARHPGKATGGVSRGLLR